MTSTRNRPTVLILASDPAFSREVTAHWPQETAPHAERPEFVVLEEGLFDGLRESNYDLVIADACSGEKQTRHDKHSPLHRFSSKNLKQALAGPGRPANVIHSDPARGLYDIHGAVLELRREPGIWPAMTGLIAREILRRRHAESRSREAEQFCAVAEAEATLGRYIVEMHTNINNALTTVLGNAELLVHESGLPASVLAQADTIRNMALRLHEIFQRFSSLEKELSVAARESGRKAASAGTTGN